MAFNHKWEVTKLDALVEYQGFPTVVYGVQFKVTTTKDDSIYKVEQHSSVGFQPHTIVNFTPYENLTEEAVLVWVKTLLNTAQDTIKEADGVTPKLDANGVPLLGEVYSIDRSGDIERSGERQLLEMITPTIIQPALPWSK